MSKTIPTTMAPNISRRVRPENLRVKQPIARKAASRAEVVTMLVPPRAGFAASVVLAYEPD
jgi:hypothetical protein